MPINQSMIMLQEDIAAGSRQHTAYLEVTSVPTGPTNPGQPSGYQYQYQGTAPEQNSGTSQNSVSISFGDYISFAEGDQVILTLKIKSTTSASVSVPILATSLGGFAGGTTKMTKIATAEWSEPFTITYAAYRNITTKSLILKMVTTAHSPVVQVQIVSLERVT